MSAPSRQTARLTARPDFAILESTVFRRLLVPVDFSACSVQAARHACQLTRMVGGTIILLHVLDGRTTPGAARERLRRLGEEARHRPVICVVPLQGGEVAATILDVAQAERADLLILGTHGRDDLGSGVLGQVALRLVLTADLPVHLVPERLRTWGPHSRWLMPTPES